MKIKEHLEQACILAVDDEDQNLLLFDQILQHAGYRNIILNKDSRQTLELYQKHKPDIILLDINMPYLDGFEVLEILKSNASDELPPVLFITAQTQKEYCEQALEKGASDFITKPFSIKEVNARVKNLIEVNLFRKQMRQQHQLLEEKVKQRTLQLEEAEQKLRHSRLQIVQRLGRAAEYRDNATGFHILRMSKVSMLLAKAVGLSDYECDLILNASPMHDIGKIGISDSILLRDDMLDPEAWEVMKTHAQIGASLLHGDDSELLSMARDIALTHHEKWDGSGYPNGLKGKEIPLVGRICAIADVFDALISERPYKKAWSIEKAVDYINDESGKHFDPALVKLFNANLSEIYSILNQYAESA